MKNRRKCIRSKTEGICGLIHTDETLKIGANANIDGLLFSYYDSKRAFKAKRMSSQTSSALEDEGSAETMCFVHARSPDCSPCDDDSSSVTLEVLFPGRLTPESTGT